MLVHANRHFQRPCRVTDGKAPPRYLAHYAVDLVRLSNGRWHVLADHTEVPSGIGYAIEMRRVLARSLPEAFRSIPVRHLRPFVDRWHDSLLAMAPAGMAQPNMAVLTPGSLSATYFEHVYLSRVLGVPLVEGGDLVARDGEVSIKTLAGLRPVHMLLRRLDSSFADPLELRADSALGVTGLVEATRTGAISLANALGSGVVETPAMMPFLERLSEQAARPALAPAVARRVVAGRARRAHLCAGQPRPDDRAALPGGRPRADRRRHAGSRPSARRWRSASAPSPATSWRSIP